MAKTPKRTKRSEGPSGGSGNGEILKIAVTFPRPGEQEGLVRSAGYTTPRSIEAFIPTDHDVGRALDHLTRLGFKATARGRLSVSIRGPRDLFQHVFGTKLTEFTVSSDLPARPQANSVLFPAPDAPWQPQEELRALIDDAYIQWPHLYFNSLFTVPPSPLPPQVGYHHLRVPGDLTWLLNVDRVHREGTTGKGVKVVMIDSGFAHGRHPYFRGRGYVATTVLAPGANAVDEDGSGHGTGESANLLAVAPDVTFFGIKLDNEDDPAAGATILEGFQQALQFDPQVISVSLGYDLCDRTASGNTYLASLPNGLRALEAEIQAIVARGVVVVFSAGNGHVSFPGMMPDVISAGGVFVADDGTMTASDYASAFRSRIYPGRHVPDFCGLVGMMNNGAAYVMLPVPAGCELDQLQDGTRNDVGWSVFSGTSAAAPQLAGVCALLLSKNPGLSPGDIKAVLSASARDVDQGSANPASSETGVGMPAGTGNDGATGTGLVDALAALRLV